MCLSRQILAFWGLVFIVSCGGIINASELAKHVALEEDVIIILEENKTLLDTQEYVNFMWQIDTIPERRQVKFFNISDRVDLTYLNVTPEFDLTPFKGVEGVWVFAHTVRFEALHHAYFTKAPTTERDFFHRVEIQGYLHGNSTLLFFNSTNAIIPCVAFNGNGQHYWQLFEVEVDLINNFRLEIHTSDYGDFGFLDKVTGFFGGVSNPPPFTITEGCRRMRT